MENPTSLVVIMMVVVFLVLIVLIFAVWLMGKIIVALQGAKNTTPPAAGGQPRENAPNVMQATAAPVVADGIDEETVAVITAAIAAYQAAEGTTGIIRGIARRTEARGRVARGAWGDAAVIRNTAPFFGR